MKVDTVVFMGRGLVYYKYSGNKWSLRTVQLCVKCRGKKSSMSLLELVISDRYEKAVKVKGQL